MPDTIVVGILSLIGTLCGTFGGIYTTNKLLSYRIEKLEEAVKESNKITDRVYKLETHNTIQDTRLDTIEEEQDRLINDVRLLKNRS